MNRKEKMLKSTTIFITLCLFLTALTACNRPDSPYAQGEHNLSKGKCNNVNDGKKNRSKEKTVLYTCEMIGGEFEPRKPQKRILGIW